MLLTQKNAQLEALYVDLQQGMRRRLANYEYAFGNLVDFLADNRSFKSSLDRGNSRFDFVPTNLHVNRIAVIGNSNQIMSYNDIVSVGAFTNASSGFKYGGLCKLASFLSLSSSSHHKQYPAPDFYPTSFAQASPIAAAVSQLRSHPVGKAMNILQEGTVMVAHLIDDLRNIHCRILAIEQSQSVAKRLMSQFSALFSMLNDQILVTITDGPAFKSLKSELDKLAKVLTRVNEKKKTISDENSSDDETTEAGVLVKFMIDNLRHIWLEVSRNMWHQVLQGLLHTPNALNVPLGLPPEVKSEASANAENMDCTSSRYLTGQPTISWFLNHFHYRYHVVMSQCLTTVTSALYLAVPRWSEKIWQQMITCGVPVSFECLLNANGDEQGMLEDWFWATDSLFGVDFVLVPANTTPKEDSEIMKPDFRIISLKRIELTIPYAIWKKVPENIKFCSKVELKLHPIMFTVSINDPFSYLSRSSIQSSINHRGLRNLKEYFSKYTQHFGAPAIVKVRPDTTKQDEVCDLITDIQHLISSGKSKRVKILKLAAAIARGFSALRFTSCKSAKDRTAMSVTLEHVRWLVDSEDMEQASFTSSLDALRSRGLRLDIVHKNVSTRKYAFNRLQLMNFPKLYRPPNGTYSNSVST
ncbi:Inositol polyphosphate 4-phosphatase type II [Cichlidogyrus casuarinus]|uniref:Inositol polyphosphate 4-phosphatase type II n=1 Tax=Cichlidogyrus casuarinus TaxID=1844966 RepID=A0ABD2PXY5_9PLAT